MFLFIIPLLCHKLYDLYHLRAYSVNAQFIYVRAVKINQKEFVEIAKRLHIFFTYDINY